MNGVLRLRVLHFDNLTAIMEYVFHHGEFDFVTDSSNPTALVFRMFW